MTNRTYEAQKKLNMRLSRHALVVVDCIKRSNDGLSEAGTDYFDLTYVQRQLALAEERLRMMLDLVADHKREYPAELEQRDC